MMSITEIMKLLPHRYPMLLVDRILELEDGKRLVGLKNVSSQPWSRGIRAVFTASRRSMPMTATAPPASRTGRAGRPVGPAEVADVTGAGLPAGPGPKHRGRRPGVAAVQ